MSSHIEGLGYTMRNYDPCFNYNADRFCCSKRGYHHRENVLLSNCQLTKSNDYSRPRNFMYGDDARPQWIKTLGVAEPQGYVFTPQDTWNIWCGRMPCSVDQKGVPCQAKMPVYNRPVGCACGKSGNGQCKCCK